MRSIAFAVVIFAGILACSSAAPQLSRFDLGWLEAVLREAGRNSTVRFGNNTIIISGVSNAVASTNDGVINPTPPSNQWHNHGWNPWNNNRYPNFNGGYWRASPNLNGEEPLSSSEESQEVVYEISDEPSEEDVNSQEDQTAEDEEDEEIDEAEHELNGESEDTIEEAQEIEDEEIDPEEEAVDAELEVIEKELAAKESN